MSSTSFTKQSFLEKYSNFFEELDLEISEDDWPSAEKVQKAFRKKCLVIHPDRGGDSDVVCSLLF
jgi:hypothetical protein